MIDLIKSISGNTQGAVFYHLRASRPFVSAALASTPSPANRELCSFLIELYAYMILVTNITFDGDCVSQGLLQDPLLSSLEQLRPERTYGFMMGAAHGLFELIPGVCRLANKRLQERSQEIIPLESVSQYSLLEQAIRNWQIPSDLQGEGEWPEQLSTAAHIYKYALLIFLHTAFHCSPVADDQIINKLQPEIDVMFPLAQRLLSYETYPPLFTTMLWPTMVVGSCVRHPVQRELVRNALLGSPFKMAIIDQAALLLDLLWSQNAESENPLFGPMGLQIVMQENGISFCMA